MRDTLRRVGALTAIALLAGGLLTACTFSVGGGLAATVIALLVGGGLLVTATTQSGCDGCGACLSMIMEGDQGNDARQDGGTDHKVSPCLSVDAKVPDTKIGPCLKVDAKVKPDMKVGPCLSPPAPDMKVGPCLKPPKPDMKLTPCLSVPKPDMKVGPCLKPPKPDMKLTPCLSPPPPGSASLGPSAAEPTPAVRDRQAVVARLQSRLPSDLAARLNRTSRS